MSLNTPSLRAPEPTHLKTVSISATQILQSPRAKSLPHVFRYEQELASASRSAQQAMMLVN
jgi:hypothetical protein